MRAEAAGLSWPLPEGMDDQALEAKFPPPRPRSQRAGRCQSGERSIVS